jgi:peptidoglycan/xylan/chitin deacetylase (PgdA/CDA1 family)
MLFTTSWDDGTALDAHTADLLERFGCKGTFYACPGAGLRTESLRTLAQRHEVGAHTLSHAHLIRLPIEEARKEIEGGKRWVEEGTGHPCQMFCYPYGEVNAAVRRLVQEAGFRGARTTERFRFTGSDPFLLPTSLQVHPFPWRRSRGPLLRLLDPLGPLRTSWRTLWKFHLPLSAFGSWTALAQALFTCALEAGSPFFHLWGHSEEVEHFGMWQELQQFLAFVRKHGEGITYAPNSALLSLEPSLTAPP